MTEDELKLLMSDFPTLYHMAAPGSWPSIRDYGLLSTTALLDRYKVRQPRRNQIKCRHRPESVKICSPALPTIVIRDQKAMSDGGLRQCLQGNLSPPDWYEILNSMVFFWLSKDRLHGMISAKGDRYSEHNILEVDTQSLVQAHRAAIRLCPINSGCTNPSRAKRCESSFLPISDYPYSCWRKIRRSRKKAVVELTVMRSVPDIGNHVVKVTTKRNAKL